MEFAVTYLLTFILFRKGDKEVECFGLFTPSVIFFLLLFLIEYFCLLIYHIIQCGYFLKVLSPRTVLESAKLKFTVLSNLFLGSGVDMTCDQSNCAFKRHFLIFDTYLFKVIFFFLFDFFFFF